MTPSDLQKLGAGASRRLPGATPSKWKNVKTAVGGITFHSQKEAERYQELRLLALGRKIRNLRLQPRYGLCPLILEKADCRDINAGTPTIRRLPVVHYVADFEYEESHLGEVWNLVVEDVKGKKTEAYGIKKRWFEAQYGIQIRET